MLASRFSGIENRDFSRLRKLWYGGEACPVESLRALKSLFPHLEFAQCYGPSEVCNNATLYEFTEIPEGAQGYMPLGGPLRTVKAYVVDQAGRLLQGPGLGELYLGGIQVMEGYINDPELTRTLLVENPFKPGDPYKVYKTGDFVRVDEAGLLSFHGRKDDLVKVRGNRVSLHEVQAVMVSLEGVLDAAVFVKKDPELLDAMIAILVSQQELELSAIRDQVRSKLPAHSQPDRYVIAERSKVPLKENGKVDRPKLIELYAN
jgi:acyl-CoA synthetase (AMP-forming)/AMP-acid ligase II